MVYLKKQFQKYFLYHDTWSREKADCDKRERKVYVSAVKVPYIKTIYSGMLPRCAIEKKRQ